jgi:hypothetical protein
MENMNESMNKRVSIEDLKLNFKTLNDMLYVKFCQLEDVKQGVRDMLTYQKYFYPI